MEKPRAVIYIRVSDPSQIENNSLETQLKTCQGYAERSGLEVVKTYSEEGVSAKTTYNRPEMRSLLEYCTNKKNNISQVIVYKMDRFSRNTEDALVTISVLAKKGVGLISATEATQADPMGTAMRTILIALAQLDNELKGARVKDNMLTMFRNGIWPFKCPKGYFRPGKDRHEKRGQAPQIDSKTSPIIKSLFDKASNGFYSKVALADYLNSLGYKKFYGKEADGETVKEILGNTFYYGNMYGPKWKEYHWGNHVKLVEQEVWDLAYYNVLGKKRMLKHQDSSIFPLKGILKCANCNHEMTSSNPKGRSKNYLCYECHKETCTKQERIGVDQAHEQFKAILAFLKPSKRVIAIFKELVFDEWDKNVDELNREAKLKDGQIERLENELTGIALSNSKGILNDDEAKTRVDRLRNEITVLRVERSDMKFDQYDTEAVKGFTESFLTNLDKFWLALDLPQKQALQNQIFPNGVICQDKKIRTANLSRSFELIQALKNQNSDYVTPVGVEPTIAWMKARSPRPLDDGAKWLAIIS